MSAQVLQVKVLSGVGNRHPGNHKSIILSIQERLNNKKIGKSTTGKMTYRAIRLLVSHHVNNESSSRNEKHFHERII